MPCLASLLLLASSALSCGWIFSSQPASRHLCAVRTYRYRYRYRLRIGSAAVKSLWIHWWWWWWWWPGGQGQRVCHWREEIGRWTRRRVCFWFASNRPGRRWCWWALLLLLLQVSDTEPHLIPRSSEKATLIFSPSSSFFLLNEYINIFGNFLDQRSGHRPGPNKHRNKEKERERGYYS